MDEEISAMSAISVALQQLDEDACERVLDWANKKFAQRDRSWQKIPAETQPIGSLRIAEPVAKSPQQTANSIANLDEIVECGDDGSVRVICRDLKANSRNDAAIRLAHIVIYANEVLTQAKETSSRNVLLQILKEWRAYDANTRVAISRHQGIKRNGDLLSLDIHSKREAEKYIKQILDPSIKGDWQVNGSRRRLKTNGNEVD